MELTLDQALQKGIEAHKAGQFQEADQYYTAILKANPKHPDANHNMGVLAVGVGKLEVALSFFQTALESNLSIVQYWLSYIDALIKLNRIDDAKAVFEQAKSKGVRGDSFEKIGKKLDSSNSKKSNTQEPPQHELKRLINLYTQGQYQEALTQALQLLDQFPDSIIPYNIIGAANKGLGKLDEAMEAYTKAISIKPDYIEAYNNMGLVLQEQGKLEEAIGAYNKALSIKPDYAEVNYNMGNAFKEQGKLEEAIEAYNEAISIKPNFEEAYYNMGNTLKGIVFTKPNRNLQKMIVSLLDRERYVRSKNIAKAAISLLKFEPSLKKYLQLNNVEVMDSPLEVISELHELPLLMKLMSACPLPDLELEGLFTKLRCSILFNISSLKKASPKLLRFQSALASQCFTNEYIYSHTDEEEKTLQALDASIKKALENKEQPSPQAVLALASYKTLNKYDWSNLLAVTDDIKEVFCRQFEEPNEEEKIKQDLPILEEITNSTSSTVRAQYEESPYPRWVNLGLHLKSISISELVNGVNLKLYDNKIIEVETPEILVAGCGTGQDSIGTSARFKSSKVLAIDLSLSSLAYAKRKTKELSVENIEYMQADILDLGKLNRQFDIIESAGVLHHMNNPMAGWRVLTDCLRQGGLMKVGLYSELARQHILKIRQEISSAGIGSSNEEMRSFRDRVIGSDKAHHKQILRFRDFYSLSELRDLLFHVQEHRFTIPQLKQCLNELGLKFCGFEQTEVIPNFQQKNKDKEDLYDLDKWQVYEQANPITFSAMYQFWCQKADFN